MRTWSLPETQEDRQSYREISETDGECERFGRLTGVISRETWETDLDSGIVSEI